MVIVKFNEKLPENCGDNIFLAELDYDDSIINEIEVSISPNWTEFYTGGVYLYGKVYSYLNDEYRCIQTTQLSLESDNPSNRTDVFSKVNNCINYEFIVNANILPDKKYLLYGGQDLKTIEDIKAILHYKLET